MGRRGVAFGDADNGRIGWTLEDSGAISPRLSGDDDTPGRIGLPMPGSATASSVDIISTEYMSH